MKGKHKIEVRSGRVVFTIELERNITILRGDSATGKTTLVEMLQAYETYGRQSGVTVSCDKLVFRTLTSTGNFFFPKSIR